MLHIETVDSETKAAIVTDIGTVASFFELKGGKYLIYDHQKSEVAKVATIHEAYAAIVNIADKVVEEEVARITRTLAPAIEHKQQYPLLNKTQRKAIAQKKGLLNIVRAEVKEELRAEMEKRCRTPTPHLNALRRMGG